LANAAISNRNEPTHNNLTNMSEETNKPESISDEQLEDVAGGINDTTSIQSVSCSNVLSTVNIA
jgi:hypothetical protein